MVSLLITANAFLLYVDYLFYEGSFPLQKHFFYAGFNATFYFFTSTAFSLITNWQKAMVRKRNLLNENKTAELNLLRSQVNPHFLFNILNSIYALSLKKSGETTRALERLNSALNYMTDSSPKEMIRLEEEVRYLKNIIELQKLRMRYPENLSFTLQVNDINSTIPPLLLLPLVENCFKHGNISGKTALIKLKLKQSEKELYFFTENEFRQMPEESGGIGIENLKKRLNILYPSTHSFQTSESGNKFTAELKLVLSR
jgi:LytS/YehU family sensor histidine kinase